MKPFNLEEHLQQFAKTVYEAEEAERLRILKMAFEAGWERGWDEYSSSYWGDSPTEPTFEEWLQARLVEASGA